MRTSQIIHIIFSYILCRGDNMRIKVPKRIHPPEAKEIAGKFRQAATEARKLASQLQVISNALDSSWEGRAKDRFMADFRSEPGNLNSYADYLEHCARKIEDIEVTVWEEKDE